GLDRSTIYVTNAVKHFKFEWAGKRRLHKSPRLLEMRACRPWLERELAAVQPRAVVALGATAGKTLCGPDFRLTQSRGEIEKTDFAERFLATYHPSAVLRAQDPTGAEELRHTLVTDLRHIADWLASGSHGERKKGGR
ncbi:MAG: uracil-DNA glycosylase family protein, partial [Parvularcula sp.]|nr:uracil-DNA glycosylase family protein [Parvularcula sp.]